MNIALLQQCGTHEILTTEILVRTRIDSALVYNGGRCEESSILGIVAEECPGQELYCIHALAAAFKSRNSAVC